MWVVGGVPSSRMRQMIVPSLVLIMRVPSSASAADVATNLKRDVRMCMSPFNSIGCLSWGSHPRKKVPLAQVLALGAPRYEAL